MDRMASPSSSSSTPNRPQMRPSAAAADSAHPLYSVPSKVVSREVSRREMDDLNILLKDMIKELESFPPPDPTTPRYLTSSVNHFSRLQPSSSSSSSTPQQHSSRNNNHINPKISNTNHHHTTSRSSSSPAFHHTSSYHNQQSSNQATLGASGSSRVVPIETLHHNHYSHHQQQPTYDYINRSGPDPSLSTSVAVSETASATSSHNQRINLNQPNPQDNNNYSNPYTTDRQQTMPKFRDNPSNISGHYSSPSTPAMPVMTTIHQNHPLLTSGKLSLGPTQQKSPPDVQMQQPSPYSRCSSRGSSSGALTPASVPKPIILTPVAKPVVQTPLLLHTTRPVPGAKICLEDEENRSGVYASVYGNKKLSRNERDELDQLINSVMDEVKHFPDHNTPASGHFSRISSFRNSSTKLNARNTESPSGGSSRIQSIIPPPERNSSLNQQQSTIAPTINRNSQLSSHQQNLNQHLISRQQHLQRQSSSPATTGVVRSASAGSGFSHVTSGFRGKSKSPSRGFKERPSYSPNAQHEFSARTGEILLPVVSNGLTSKPLEPLPPRLLTRPTPAIQDEASRPYHARPESKPFNYGVTPTSPELMRRRVHSESTAYVSQNDPNPINYQNTPSNLTLTQRSGSALGHYYDGAVQSRGDQIRNGILHNTNMIPLEDEENVPWLTKQQLKLRNRRDNLDGMSRVQTAKEKLLMNELRGRLKI